MCPVCVLWPGQWRGEERERERGALSRDGDRSQAEIRNNVKDGGGKLPWPWGDQIVICKDAFEQSQ